MSILIVPVALEMKLHCVFNVEGAQVIHLLIYVTSRGINDAKILMTQKYLATYSPRELWSEC